MSDVVPADPAVPAGEGRRLPPGLLVGLLTALQAALAAALLTVVSPEPLRAVPVGVGALLGVAFLLAELYVFHIEFRREAITISLAEVALAFGLLGMPVGVLVGTRLLGTLTALLIAGRPSASKLLFNAANLTFDTLVAAAIFEAITTWSNDPHDAVLLLALLPALTLASFLSGIAVSVAVSCYEGGLWANIRQEIVEGPRLAFLLACLAAMTVSPTLISLWLLPLALVPLGAIWFVARLAGIADQHNRDLEEMHSFARLVGRSLDITDIAAAATTEVERLVRAACSRMVVFDPETGDERLRRGDARLDAVLPDTPAAWAYQLSLGPCIRVSRTDETVLGMTLGQLGLRELVVVAVADEQGLIGALAIADRVGVADRFDAAEIRRLAALADQLGVTLRRSFLHEHLERDATRDRLTGRPNRAMLERLGTQSLRDAAPNQVIAAFTIGFERFGELTETLGHDAGDALVQLACTRLGTLLHAEDTLARISASELAITASRTDRQALYTLADRCSELLNRPYAFDELTLSLDAQIGVALFPDHGDDVPTLLRRADIARRQAVSDHDRWGLYRPTSDRDALERLALLGELRHGIEAGQLELYYQPKLDLATGAITGAEALVRWNHPTRGFVLPDAFIPLAERTGMIDALTAAVLEEAFVTVADWHKRGWRISIAVNVSIHNLTDDLLPDRIARLLERHQIDARYLVLEITESSVMTDATRSLRTLERLDALGIGLSVDDFGTGYSSLSYLRSLPVREMKIDRSFVSEILAEEHDEVIVQSTIALAHSLGLRVVAEGVESEEIARHLSSLGCDVVQGYWIARPLSYAGFVEFMTEQRHRFAEQARQMNGAAGPSARG